jgi:hypothetical protein
MSRRPLFLIALLAAGLPLLVPRAARAQATSDTVTLPLQFALYQGRGAYFVAREYSSLPMAVANHGVWTPALGRARAAGVSRMYLFTNGIADQPPILDAVPAEASSGSGPSASPYSPIWEVSQVRWLAPEAERRLVGADDDIMRLVADKKVEVTRTGARLNGPVVLFDGDLSGNGVRLAATLKSPEQVVSFTAADRKGSVVMAVAKAFWLGQEVPYARFESAPKALPPALAGAMTVEKIGLDKIGHAAVGNFYVILDKDGMPAQPQPVIDAAPGFPLFAYTPLWHVHTAQWKGTPRLLKSAPEIFFAAVRGQLTLTAGDDQATFNGPVALPVP